MSFVLTISMDEIIFRHSFDPQHCMKSPKQCYHCVLASMIHFAKRGS